MRTYLFDESAALGATDSLRPTKVCLRTSSARTPWAAVAPSMARDGETVVLTGASGYLGEHVLARLLADSHVREAR